MNALSPYLLDDTRSIDNKLDELDLNMRAGVYGTIRSFIITKYKHLHLPINEFPFSNNMNDFHLSTSFKLLHAL